MDPEGVRTFIREQVGSDSLDLESSLRQYAASIGADSLALDYINTMISKVDSYLKSQQPDTRIVVQKAKVSDKDNIDATPQFKMQYSLKEEDETPPESPSEVGGEK